jgi:hypothetical protein
MDGSEPTTNPFLAPVTYSEVYDGSGSRRQFLRNSPIQSVTSLQIGWYTVPQSLGWGQQGWVIDGSRKSISLRGGSTANASANFLQAGSAGRFVQDIQNVAVTYSAGYLSLPDDILEVAIKQISLAYKRKGWIGLRSKSMGQGAGSTTYADWIGDPQVMELIQAYKRWTP